MRALVTGGAGFIGSAIAKGLLANGDDVVVLDNLVTGTRSNVPDAARFIEGDIRTPEDVAAACAGVEVVFHEAALRSVARSVEAPLETNDTNANGTLNLLVAAEQQGVRRVVYASSSSIYGEARAAEGIRMPSPISPYGVSKLAGELYCKVWSSLGRLETVSLRYFNVFGPGQRPDTQYSAVFPAFIDALAGGERPEINWDGKQTRSFTYVEDVVRANLMAATSTRANGHAFDLGAADVHSVLDVFDEVSRVMCVDLEPRFSEKRVGDIRDSRADQEAARSLLGWSAETPWPEAVENTVRWFRERS